MHRSSLLLQQTSCSRASLNQHKAQLRAKKLDETSTWLCLKAWATAPGDGNCMEASCCCGASERPSTCAAKHDLSTLPYV